MRSKRRPEAHVTGERAVKILRELLPAHWVLREYQPDYGIDIDLELFENAGNDANGNPVYDALGEHVFLQVKGCKELKATELKVADHDSTDINVPVYQYQLETSELVTVQKMGTAVPVLLTLIEVTSGRAFFLCLNDYIDKVLLPSDNTYAAKASKLIYVPSKNEIRLTDEALIPFRFYGKRAKLMAAFDTFRRQRHELSRTDHEDLIAKAVQFCDVLLRYDFWQQCEWWAAISDVYERLRDLREKAESGWLQTQVSSNDSEAVWVDEYSGDKMYSKRAMRTFTNIRVLWDNLAGLGNLYDTFCREWFLPTFTGHLAS